MKKLIILSLAVLTVAATVSSCKTRENCPAYGKNSTSYHGRRG